MEGSNGTFSPRPSESWSEVALESSLSSMEVVGGVIMTVGVSGKMSSVGLKRLGVVLWSGCFLWRSGVPAVVAEKFICWRIWSSLSSMALVSALETSGPSFLAAMAAMVAAMD